jgi:hypothetical protein
MRDQDRSSRRSRTDAAVRARPIVHAAGAATRSQGSVSCAAIPTARRRCPLSGAPTRQSSTRSGPTQRGARVRRGRCVPPRAPRPDAPLRRRGRHPRHGPPVPARQTRPSRVDFTAPLRSSDPRVMRNDLVPNRTRDDAAAYATVLTSEVGGSLVRRVMDHGQQEEPDGALSQMWPVATMKACRRIRVEQACRVPPREERPAIRYAGARPRGSPLGCAQRRPRDGVPVHLTDEYRA